jgi:chromosome transmission fidelity protein 1
MDAITSIHTIEISLQQTQLARAQLTTYLQRFRNRLKGKNRVYVTQVVRLLDSISSFLVTACVAGKSGGGDEGGSMVQATELLKGKGVDQINLYKLMRYLQESKLARKVDGYVSLEQQQQQKQHINTTINNNNKITSNAGKEVTVPVLSQMQSLFMVLTNPAREGRLFYIPPPASATEQDKTQAKLKYMLLDPSEHFREIVEEARTVILAGGTMSPVS